MYESAAASDAIQRVVDRLVKRQVAYLDAAQQRREKYVADQQAAFAKASEPSWTEGFKKTIGKIFD